MATKKAATPKLESTTDVTVAKAPKKAASKKTAAPTKKVTFTLPKEAVQTA